MSSLASGFPTPSMPGKKVPGGLNYLQEEALRKKFRDAVVELVRLATPHKLGVVLGGDVQANRDAYADALYIYIESNPHVLAELIKNQKLTFADFSKTDKAFIAQVLKEEVRKLRPTIDNTTFKTRIVPQDSKGWLEFREVDCFFAALLAALGYRPAKARINPAGIAKDRREKELEKQEQDEREAEAWLVKELNLSQRVTPDATLIFLMEQQLGWERVADGSRFSEFKAGRGVDTSYILSYQKSGDSWHVVYVSHQIGGAWSVIDRQATAQGGSGAIPDTARCDAWQVENTAGFRELQTAFDNR